MIQNFFLRRLQYNRQAWRFFMAVIALGFAIDGVYAVLLNLYLLRLDYDALFIGQVNSFGLLTFAVVSLPAGILGTRWRSTWMLRLGLGATLLGTFLLPLAEFTPSGWQNGWFIITYALILAGFSLFFVNGSPFLMTVVEPKKHNSAFALQTALLASAAFIGSLIGGMLPAFISSFFNFTIDDPEPYRYTMMTVAAVMLIAFLVVLTIAEQPQQDEEELPQPENTPRITNLTRNIIIVIAIMSLIRFLQVGGMATTSVYFNVYMDTEFAMRPSIIGAIASVGRLLAVPTVLLAPRLIRRSSTGGVALAASTATALFLLPIALVPSEWAAALGYIGSLAVTNLRYTAFIVYILLLVPKRQQSIMAGAGEAAAGFSFAFMALIGGYIATATSFRDLFLLGAIFIGIGNFIFWLYLRHTNIRKMANATPV